MHSSVVRSTDRLVGALRVTFFAVLLAALAYFVYFSWHWPILRDTSVMHYVVFLMDHGLKPYQQITDNNLPGAYIMERWGMLLFGRGDLAWRLCDLSLLAAITLAMAVIARPYSWLAGLYGGGMFALLHGSEGPDFPMEREEILTALLVVALALLFVSLRRSLPALMLLFGVMTGMAASIKPTSAPFGIVLLCAAAFVARRKDRAPLPYLLWGLGGMAVASVIVLTFLLRNHAIGPLLYIIRTIMPSYVSMSNRSFGDLLRSMMPRNLLLIAALGAALALVQRSWNAERWLVFLGMIFGAVSFLAQRKGSIYHRYPFVAFLLLLLGLEFVPALRRRGLPLALGAAGLIATLLLSIPHYIVQLHSSPPNSTMPFAATLTSDLRTLGATTDLQQQVECLDLTYGCFSALYHLNLLENNGFTGDLLLFSAQKSAAAEYYRRRFWDLTMAHPPSVFVLSNEWYPYDVSFRKLDTWPEFRQYLSTNYQQVRSRSFPPTGPAPGSDDVDSRVPGYRIYVRRGSPLLAAASSQGRPTS